jgi:2-keto-4-pentenoate hydratase/2-oxohepta-3-ene-1,7-dioic acid hydratase in catechol pathway
MAYYIFFLPVDLRYKLTARAIIQETQSMKLVTFTHNKQSRVGAVIDDAVVDSQDCAEIPLSMIEFLGAGSNALHAMQELIDRGSARIALNEVKLNAPVTRPGKYLGIALNYADHIAETGREQPKFPSFFSKQSNCVIG